MDSNIKLKKYYIVLSGAKKNIGDFLITERAIKLLKKHKPETDFYIYPSWMNLDNDLEKVNKSLGIIILGGPGYQFNMYPKIYKLVKNIERLKVPIIPMGLGWFGMTSDSSVINEYTFNKNTIQLLKKTQDLNLPLSCRDYYTKEILKRSGFKNVIMTGCPVWYDIDSINKEIKVPEKITKIVFTPPQNPLFRKQSLIIMKKIKKIFPDSDIYCSFHRGMGEKDKFTEEYEIKNNIILKKYAEDNGLIPVDSSYDMKNISFYDECDIHIGYRVHGHIYFLSKRKPSFLLHEDGRGKGVSDALGVKGIDAFEKTLFSGFIWKMKKGIIKKIFKKVFRIRRSNKNAPELLERYILNEVDSGFIRFSGVPSVIDKNYEIMVNFIKKLS